MKKIFFLVAVVCSVAYSYPTYAVNSQPVFQSDDLDISEGRVGWESIGRVIAVSALDGSRKEATLYVKCIGNKYFYQLRIGLSSTRYSVSIGKYSYGGEFFNAKAGDYYFTMDA